jgi:hypothetical protein
MTRAKNQSPIKRQHDLIIIFKIQQVNALQDFTRKQVKARHSLAPGNGQQVVIGVIGQGKCCHQLAA